MTNADRTEIKDFAKSIVQEGKTRIEAKYVAQETGKSLISDTEVTRLAGMETGAQVNVIESVSIKGGAAGTIANKTLTLDLDDYAKKTDVSAALNYKGSVDTFAELPASGMSNGDVYNVKSQNCWWH